MRTSHRLSFILAAFVLSACSYQNETQRQGEDTTLQRTVEHYGDFTIVTEGKETTLHGGIFEPSESLPSFIPDDKLLGIKHLITVSFTRKSLEYFRRDERIFRGEFGRVVITPRAERLTGPVYGRVRYINLEPSWCPTVNIRASPAYQDLPPGCIPFGHEQNAMGMAKFEIAWNRTGWEAVRLHGTPRYPRHFYEEETFGCVRLLDDHILELVDLLGSDAVSEGVLIVFHA